MLKLKEGQFVKLTGATLKGDNDIYIVDKDYTKPNSKSTVITDGYRFNKVKLNGIKKEGAYDLFFFGGDSMNQNPNMKIEVVTDLKKAKKEVNEYLKNLNKNEIIVTIEESENKKIKEGSVVRFTKSCELEGKYMCKNTLWKVHFVRFQVGGRIFIESLGKQGQQISNRKLYDFSQEASDLILNEYIEVVDLVEIKRGDLMEKSEELKVSKNNKNKIIEELQEDELNKNIKEMNKFEKIKNQTEGKFGFDDYIKWGSELYFNLIKLGIDGSERFKNDAFEIVPYDWSGSQDCTCYYDKEIDNLYYNGATEDDILKFENTHMHDIDCSSRVTNFYHASTGVIVEWRKSMSRFNYINKKISYEDWQEIVQDCVKSVMKDEYIQPLKEIKLDCVVNFGEHNITEKEFQEKFNQFISKNGWNIK